VASRRSTLDVLDTWLLVAVGIVVAVFALQILSWIVGTVLFLVKVALVAGVIAVAVRVASGRKERRLRRGYRGELR
jgi:hypothetical protein